MPSLVKLGYNHIPRMCTDIEVSVEDSGGSIPLGDNDLPVENLFYGGSTIYWRNSDTTPIVISQFDLTINSVDGAQTADYLAIRGLNLMFKEGSGDLSIELRASTDGFVASDDQIEITTGLTDADLVGPHNEDYIVTFDETTPYQYWRIIITSENECIHRMRKIYFGKAFDFEASPFYPYEPGYGNNGSAFTADNGAVFKTSLGRRARALQFNWRGISDALRVDFDRMVRRYLSDFPLFLFHDGDDDHDPLSGDTLIFGWADAEISAEQWANNNLVRLQFAEDIVG